MAIGTGWVDGSWVDAGWVSGAWSAVVAAATKIKQLLLMGVGR